MSIRYFQYHFNVNKNIDLKGKSVNNFILEASKVLKALYMDMIMPKLNTSDSYTNDK